MKLRKKDLSIGLLIILVAALASPGASSAAPTRVMGTDIDVQVCVDEIGKHADYDSSSRALHRVVRLKQKNLVELSIEIETSIFASEDDSLIHKYETACVINPSHALVKFRINGAKNTR